MLIDASVRGVDRPAKVGRGGDPCWQHRPLLDRYLNTHRVDARVASAAGLAVEGGRDIQQAADLQRRQLAPLSAVGSEELRPAVHRLRRKGNRFHRLEPTAEWQYPCDDVARVSSALVLVGFQGGGVVEPHVAHCFVESQAAQRLVECRLVGPTPAHRVDEHAPWAGGGHVAADHVANAWHVPVHVRRNDEGGCPQTEACQRRIVRHDGVDTFALRVDVVPAYGSVGHRVDAKPRAHDDHHVTGLDERVHGVLAEACSPWRPVRVGNALHNLGRE